MQTQEILANHEPVHWGHFGAIFLCALVLAFISVMRNGFSFSPPQSASAAPQVLTYEQAQAQVLADQSSQDSGLISSPDNDNEVALIDPSTDKTGNVAGATTDVSTPSAEDIFSPKVLGATTVNLQSTPATAASLSDYSSAMTALEADNNSLSLMEALSSDDKQALAQASQSAQRIFIAMQKIPVPQGIEDYHKYQMFFYQTLGDMGDVFSGKRPDTDLQQISTQLFALIQKINDMKQDINAKYGVQL